MFIGLDVVEVDFLFINRTPRIDDVCQDEWYEETNVGHCAECELTTTTIDNCETAL